MRKTKHILIRLDHQDRVRLKQSSQEAQHLENKWKAAFWKVLQGYTDEIVAHIADTDELPNLKKFDFVDLVMAQTFDVMNTAAETASGHLELLQDPATVNLAKKPPKSVLPRSLGHIREMYDLWKRKRYVPPRQALLAENIKKAYLKKVKDVFAVYSEPWKEGKTTAVAKLREDMQKAAKVGLNRASTIVETETTNNYNQIRREIYDQSPDVVAYLFVSVRDMATTKWCSTRNGLVYHRGDPHLKTETPAIHWNCRSEILPLTRFNPRHLAMINDPALDRRNNHCEPLPKGWRAA